MSQNFLNNVEINWNTDTKLVVTTFGSAIVRLTLKVSVYTDL